ncbi:hypothetical protein BGW38_006076, partial [Lunasporangiospora selenospora]
MLRDITLDTWSDSNYALSTSKTEAMARIYSLRKPRDIQSRSLYASFSGPHMLMSNRDAESRLSKFIDCHGDQDIAYTLGYPIQPFVHSHLKELHIDFHWNYLNAEILLYLLAWFTPNLTSLRMKFPSECDKNEDAAFFRLFKVIQVADKIVASRNASEATIVGNNEANSIPRLGLQLTKVK